MKTLLQVPYLRQFLGFLGIDDVEFVYAEGLAIREESKAASLARATTYIELLTPAAWREAA